LRARIEEHLHSEPASAKRKLRFAFNTPPKTLPLISGICFRRSSPAKPGLGRKNRREFLQETVPETFSEGERHAV